LDGIGQPLDILPNTNLPLNLPLVQHQPPQNFSVKDQHLLKPPPVMGASMFCASILCVQFDPAFVVLSEQCFVVLELQVLVGQRTELETTQTCDGEM
jgi:hypothetical protein